MGEVNSFGHNCNSPSHILEKNNITFNKKCIFALSPNSCLYQNNISTEICKFSQSMFFKFESQFIGGLDSL